MAAVAAIVNTTHNSNPLNSPFHDDLAPQKNIHSLPIFLGIVQYFQLISSTWHTRLVAEQ